MKANFFTFRSLKEKPAITSISQMWFSSFFHVTKWKLQLMHLQLLRRCSMDCWLLLTVVDIFYLWCFQPVLFSLSQKQMKQCHKQNTREQRARVLWCVHLSNWHPQYSKLYFISFERSKCQTCCFANGEQESLQYLCISHSGNMSPTCIWHV